MINNVLTFLRGHQYLLTIGLILLTIATLSITLMPSTSIPSDIKLFEYDKLGHTLLFGSWTFMLGLNSYITKGKELPLLVLFLWGGLFGASVEILQELLPIGREADPDDLLADIVGCLLSVLLLRYVTNSSSSDSSDSVS